MAGPLAEVSYFTCTLGEAALLNARQPHSLKTIPTLLDQHAASKPRHPGVGFFGKPRHPASGPENGSASTYMVYDFQRLRDIAVDTAECLRSLWVPHGEDRTVALIGKSTQPFFFAWLGLVYLGYSVLLLSPDLDSSAVAHLCDESKTQKLVYDPSCQSSARSSQAACVARGHPISIYALPESEAFHAHLNEVRHPDIRPFWPVSELDVAYYHHTSGTSSGLPKLLPVNHKMAVGVLPSMQPTPLANATFSTTPIYHGGVADCFRAWSAMSLIWLYPGEVPITARSLEECIEGAQHAYADTKAPRLIYLSCVPMVLVQLAESPAGLRIMKAMDMVGVGGAAMPQALGNDLVQQGIKLLSRFGATECGFLLSSHREYADDKEWQYLRYDPETDALKFEPRERGLFELIVGETWPALAKTNRPDGSYATADLFEPHPTIENAWRYHSRSDSQVTLVTGKKFDPAPFEDSIRESPILNDVLIFGNDRPFPGALLFRSSVTGALSDQDIVDEVWAWVDANNARTPKHAKLSKSMLVLMPELASKLPKSSKGTTLRGKAEVLYRKHIEDSYLNEHFSEDSASNENEDFLGLELGSDQVATAIISIVRSVKGNFDSISIEDDLYNRGVDSKDCIMIRSRIQRKLIPPHGPLLPTDVIYDCANTAQLSEFVINFRQGIVKEPSDEIRMMRDLVARYSDWQPQKLRSHCHDAEAQHSMLLPDSKNVVLITGVTGTLGAHVLSQLRTQSSVGEIHCLVRAASSVAAQERLRKSLLYRQLAPLDAISVKICCHPCKLSEPGLGLDEKTFADLSHRVTHIIHAAWSVNFTLRLQSFVKDNIIGLYHLIQFTMVSCRFTPPHFVFCSSTASVTKSNHSDLNVQEKISDDPHMPSEMGYSRSKWVAESICDEAHRRTHLHNRISILRIGQLCGDRDHGVWSVTEAWPLMISSSKVTGLFPRLVLEPLSWLPVDIAATAVLEIAMSSPFPDSVKETVDSDVDESVQMTHPCRVYSLVDSAGKPTTVDLVEWQEKLSPTIKIVSPAEWIAELESLQGEAADHPARRLLGLWKKAYLGDDASKQHGRILYDMRQTKEVAPVMRNLPPVGEEHFRKMWLWIEKNVTIKKSLLHQEDRTATAPEET